VTRDALAASLVRLGRLTFDDFCLLEPQTVRRVLSDPATAADLAVALNNVPHVLSHMRRCCPDSSPACSSTPALPDVLAAQSRLVHLFALDLLKAKAPPLYDALAWHEWDFSPVKRRYQLWKTRVLLAGDGASAVLGQCRRTAGVYVVEPLQVIARYIEEKGRLEKTRGLQVMRAPLDRIPLRDNSADLAIVGSDPRTPGAKSPAPEVLSELGRVAASIFIVENNPLIPDLDEALLAHHGFGMDAVQVNGVGLRRCWWRREH
jgi:hypothetical protein